MPGIVLTSPDGPPLRNSHHARGNSRCLSWRGERAAAFAGGAVEVAARVRCRLCGYGRGLAVGASLVAGAGAVRFDSRGGVMFELLLDAAGRRRSPATMPEFHAGRPPRNKGMRYPADPLTIEEIITVHAPRRRRRPRAPAARPDRRAVACRPADLRGARADRGRPGPAPRIAAGPARQGRSAPRGRHGDWAWEQLEPWLKARVELPVGPLCIVIGPTRGRPWTAGAARSELRRVAREAGVRRRFAPHQLRHAHAVEMPAKACR
jgi:hypothetical protein